MSIRNRVLVALAGVGLAFAVPRILSFLPVGSERMAQLRDRLAGADELASGVANQWIGEEVSAFQAYFGAALWPWAAISLALLIWNFVTPGGRAPRYWAFFWVWTAIAVVSTFYLSIGPELMGGATTADVRASAAWFALMILVLYLAIVLSVAWSVWTLLRMWTRRPVNEVATI